MAIILDERARAAITRRRTRGKDARIGLRIDRCSLRVGVPWTFAVGWAPSRQADSAVLRRGGDVEVCVDQRIERFTRSRDLTISSARLGPWEWLVVSDPFAFERMQEWEQARLDDQEVPAVSPTAAYTYARPLHLDGSGASARTVHLAGVHGCAPQYGDEEGTRPTSVPSVAAGEAGE